MSIFLYISEEIWSLYIKACIKLTDETDENTKRKLRNKVYTTLVICLPVRGDKPQCLASGLSPIQENKSW